MAPAPRAKRTPPAARRRTGAAAPRRQDAAAARARARAETRAVRAYLTALDGADTERRRARNATALDRRLAILQQKPPAPSPLDRLHRAQTELDLRAALAEAEHASPAVDQDALAERFVAVAQDYGTRHGIRYASWRTVGVPAAVLAQAGITRGQ